MCPRLFSKDKTAKRRTFFRSSSNKKKTAKQQHPTTVPLLVRSASSTPSQGTSRSVPRESSHPSHRLPSTVDAVGPAINGQLRSQSQMRRRLQGAGAWHGSVVVEKDTRSAKTASPAASQVVRHHHRSSSDIPQGLRLPRPSTWDHRRKHGDKYVDIIERCGSLSPTLLDSVPIRRAEVSVTYSHREEEEHDEDEYSWTVCEVDKIGVVVPGRAKVIQLLHSAKICQVNGLVVIAHGADMVDISAARRRCRGSA